MGTFNDSLKLAKDKMLDESYNETPLTLCELRKSLTGHKNQNFRELIRFSWDVGYRELLVAMATGPA